MIRAVRVLSIATLFPSPARPGFGLFVKRQFDALTARGEVELTVINPVGTIPLLERAETDELDGAYPVYRPAYPRLPVIGPRLNPALIARTALPIARKLHAKRPFDLIDGQFFYPDGPAAARIAKALGLPLSIKARGSDIHLWGGNPYARSAMLAAAAQADGMLSVSEALKADMVALGMDGERIAVHYTGLDGATFQPRERADARQTVADLVPGDGPLVVSVGNLIPLKGHALVIEALANLPGLRLAIAGKGPEEANLRALAARLGVADRVHLLGSVPAERLSVLLGAAQCMALASEREGLANAWIEALACGTPLVITDVGGAREVVRSAEAGRLVERSPAAIAEGIAAVLAEAPSPHAVATTVAGFSWQANAEQLAAHYRAIVG